MAKISVQEFFSVDPTSMVRSRDLTFDVFLYLPLNERVVRIKQVGDRMEMRFVIRFMDKNVELFYVRNSDREAYEEYISELAPSAIVPDPEKPAAQILPPPPPLPPQVTAPLPPIPKQPDFVPPVPPEKVATQLLAKPGSPEHTAAVDQGKELIRQILAGAPGTDPTLAQMLDEPEAEHSTMTAIYAVLFSMGLGKKDQGVLQDMILSSFIHDIGFTQLPPIQLVLADNQRDAAQLKEFERHVPSAFELLADMEYKPNPRVLKIIAEHHEKFDGTGYPRHIESFAIDDFAQILGLADVLDRICRGRFDGVSRELPEALLVLATIEKQLTFPQFFNPDIFRRVMKWLKDGGGAKQLESVSKIVEETKNQMQGKAA